ncbi:MAG: hypothetical protein E6R03_11115 [Hyphomicrobiaceae bacterium]|nr:MAG: hypothetical protein E6R03_11115 [Hyphomicrobiaceae bacterium]
MMTIFEKAALVIRLRLETADLNYSRSVADIDRLDRDLEDPTVAEQFALADGYASRYETVWPGRAKRERSER